MYYVYILFSEKCNRYYVGYSADIQARLTRHNAGMVKATKNCTPYRFCACKELQNELGARREELQLKAKFIRPILNPLCYGHFHTTRFQIKFVSSKNYLQVIPDILSF